MSQILHKAEKAISIHEPHHKSPGPKEGSKLDYDHGKSQAGDRCRGGYLTVLRQGTHEKPIATVPREGKTAGNTKKPYPDDILTSGTVGAHGTEMSDRVEQRVVPDQKLSESKGGTHGHHRHGAGSR